MKDEKIHSSDFSIMNKDFAVRYSDLDMTYSATMPAICSYFFEVGSIHGRILTEDAKLDSVFVLTRLYVKMDMYPEVEETVSVRSWLSPVKDKYVIRNFIVTGENGDIIGRGKSSAVPFNLHERTGAAIPENIGKVKTVDIEPATLHAFEKLTPVMTSLYEKSFEVSYFDCDIYQHVNNVKYIQWCIEALPVEFIKSHMLSEIDINFRTEGSVGDKLVLKAGYGGGDGIFVHTISDNIGGRELARMKSIWR